MAFFFRSSYFFWIFLERFLFKISSSSGVCNEAIKGLRMGYAKAQLSSFQCFSAHTSLVISQQLFKGSGGTHGRHGTLVKNPWSNAWAVPSCWDLKPGGS